MTTERVVVIGGGVPYPDVPHAGGRYLLALGSELASAASVTFVVPDTQRNLEGLRETAFDCMLIGRYAATSRWRGIGFRGVGALERLVRILHPGAPAITMGWAILTDQTLRRLIASADVVDLQWAEYVGLGGLIRRVNPSARIVGTFHDVLSQLFVRRATTSFGIQRWRWRRAARLARGAERRAGTRVDEVATLNQKDAVLLESAGLTPVVIDPPLGGDGVRDRQPDATPRVLLVGYFARAMNVEAARWFISEVWPLILDSYPDAVFRVVGSDPQQQLSAAVGDARGVEVAGFVSDLAEEYARARVCVVPLRLGSGVKFKAIEPLLAGVPTVSTTVGAEGIGGADRFVDVVDEPVEFAAAILRVLRDPASAEEAAREVQERLGDQYGNEQFARRITQVYRLNTTNGAVEESPTGGDGSAEAASRPHRS